MKLSKTHGIACAFSAGGIDVIANRSMWDTANCPTHAMANRSNMKTIKTTNEAASKTLSGDLGM
jgi:hypothetical protein